MNSPLGVLYLPPPSRANALPNAVSKKKKKNQVCPTEVIGLADLHAGYRPDMNFGSFARMTQNLLLVLRHRLNLSRSVFKFGFKVATVQYRERWRHNDPPPIPQPRPALLICQQHCAMSGEADTVIGRMSISPFWFIAGTRIYLRMGPKTNKHPRREVTLIYDRGGQIKRRLYCWTSAQRKKSVFFEGWTNDHRIHHIYQSIYMYRYITV